jgi:hypothetical protein
MADRALQRKVIERAVAKKAPGKRIDLTNALGTVEGWRAWNVPRELKPLQPPRLRSATWDYEWVPFQRARASCDRCTSRDPSDTNCTPGESCSCGFYTAKTLPHLRSMGYSSYVEEGGDWVTIVGRVALWGKVIEGSQGWRAEFAYPIALYCPFECWKIARPFEQEYGVPVKLLNLLDPDAKPEKARSLRDFAPSSKKREPKYLQEWREKQAADSIEEPEED